MGRGNVKLPSIRNYAENAGLERLYKYYPRIRIEFMKSTPHAWKSRAELKSLLQRFDVRAGPEEFGKLIQRFESRGRHSNSSDEHFRSFKTIFAGTIVPQKAVMRAEEARRKALMMKRQSVHRLDGEAWGVGSKTFARRVYYRERVSNKFGKVKMRTPHMYPKKSIGRTVRWGRGWFTSEEAHEESVKELYQKFHTVRMTFRSIDVSTTNPIEQAEVESLLRRFKISLSRHAFKKLLDQHGMFTCESCNFVRFLKIFGPHVSSTKSIVPIHVDHLSRRPKGAAIKKSTIDKEALLNRQFLGVAIAGIFGGYCAAHSLK
eukprot:g996.t1